LKLITQFPILIDVQAGQDQKVLNKL